MSADMEISAMLHDVRQKVTGKSTSSPTTKSTPDSVQISNGTVQNKPYVREIVWFNTIGFLLLHIGCVYGVWVGLVHASYWTDIWSFVVGFLAAQSVLLGAHRYYTHRSYKATLPLRFLIVWWQTVSSQNCLWVWVRDHRQHHKYSDTDADPHNASRGFFFSHIGWLMVRKHPEVIEKGKKIDMSDIEADGLVMFQKKYYNILYFLLAILFPVSVPVYFWGETWWNAFCVAFLARTFVVLNFAWMVNSWAHLYGTHPFNNEIMPSESRLVSFLTFGEGWHNFHHTFPWDYRAAEMGQDLNLTSHIIDMFARWGWAYDLKAASEALVRKRALRTGDGSHPRYNKEGVPNHLLEEPEPLAQEEEAAASDLCASQVVSKKATNLTTGTTRARPQRA